MNTYWKIIKRDGSFSVVMAEHASINGLGDVEFKNRWGDLVRGIKSDVWSEFYEESASYNLCFNACEEMKKEDRILFIDHLQKHIEAESK